MREQQVVDLLQREGPLSRADIARRCQISKPTAGTLVQRLLATGLIREAGTDRERLGRPGRLLRFDPHAGAVIALDVGGTTTRAVAADLQGNVVADHRRPTPRSDAAATARHLADVVATVGRASSVPATIAHVAIATPGVLDPATRRIALAPNLPALESPDFLDLLESDLPHPLTLLNDVNAATLGVHHAADVPRDLVYLGIGTGLGLGMLIGGALHAGTAGRAGEFGLVPYPPGAATTLEDHLSGAAIERLHRRAGGSGRPEEAFAEAAHGREPGASVVADLLAALTWAITAITTLLDPPRVVLGGGVGLRCAPYLEQVHATVLRTCGFAPALTITELGDDAGLHGAIAVALASARSVTPWLKGGHRSDR
jgi:predicted NBD/HSP70 family sugar kinase